MVINVHNVRRQLDVDLQGGCAGVGEGRPHTQIRDPLVANVPGLKSPAGKIIQALLGFSRNSLLVLATWIFLGFCSIDLTLSLDFQGVGQA